LNRVHDYGYRSFKHTCTSCMYENC